MYAEWKEGFSTDRQGWQGGTSSVDEIGGSHVTQAEFAKLLGVSKRTLQEWEQGRKQPSGAARTLIAIAEQRPEVLRELRL